MSHIDILGQEALQQAIVNPAKITIVDFWAEWCGPCRMLGPVLEQIAEKYADSVQVAKVNVDEPMNQPLAMQYRISSIPRVIFFVGGNIVEDFVGVQSADVISTLVEKHLGSLHSGDADRSSSVGESVKGKEDCDDTCDDCDCHKPTSGSW